MLATVGQYIADAIAKVGTFLSELFKPIIDSISVYIATVLDSVIELANTIGNKISSLIGQVVDSINAFVDEAVGFVGNLFDRVAEYLTSLYDSAIEYIVDTYNTVIESIEGIGSRIEQFVVDAYDFVTTKLTDIFETVSIYIKTLFDDIKLAVGDLIDSAARVINAIVQGIEAFISSVVDTIGGALRDLLETAGKIPGALSELGEGFSASVEEFIGKPLSEIPDIIWQSLGENFINTWGFSDAVAEAFKRPLLGRTQTSPQSRAEWDEFFAKTLPKEGTPAVIFNFVIGIFLLMRIGGGIADAQAQIVLQEFGDEFAYNIPQVADVVRLKHFGIIDDQHGIELIKKQGFSEDDAQRLIKIGETAPPEGEALSWWLRNIYNDDDIDLALSKRGWSDKDREALKQAAQIIPPVQDLITMAVREVFTPEVAERFGQFEDFPKDFNDWAAKIGLSEFWAKNYWAAHWVLPSPQMGFEMLHRRIIDVDDLNLLLKSADVMPFWRQKIVDISYAPFTRVDIRRMHKVGVLTEEEVFEAYQDIGYDVNKARVLTDFTLELNRDKSADDDVEIVNITRSNVLAFYEDGLLSRDEAYASLVDLGYTTEAAELYLTSVDLSEQRRERKDETGLILDQAKAGIISFESAQDRLAQLQLETREFTKALTQLIRQQAQRTKIPSKGDLDKMVLNNIISIDDYKITLGLIGYSNEWADRYIQLLEVT